MLMRPGHRGVNRDDPLQVRDSVRLALQFEQHPIPGAVLCPTVETPPARLPGRKILRQAPPRRPRAEPPTDRLDYRPVVAPPPTPPRYPVRQQGLDPSPHLIG